MRIRRWAVAIGTGLALLLARAPVVDAQVAGDGLGDPFATAGFTADATGGAGGEAVGGGGGQGGSGVLPDCNQSTDGDWWEEPQTECPSGGSGGAAGEGGVSEGGEGGLAFAVGLPALPAPPSPTGADLAVSQAQGSFIITIVNNGPQTAVGVVLTDTYSSSGPVEFGGVSTSQGTCSAPSPGSPVGPGSVTFTCAIGDLAPGATATVTIADPLIVALIVFTTLSLTTIVPVPITLTNAASASSSTPDPTPANNSSSLSTDLPPPTAFITTII
jgi:hypothetical protein